MDFGYHNALQRSMLLYNSCLEGVKSSHQTSIDCVVKCVQELDPNKDKQSFLQCNRSVLVMRVEQVLQVEERRGWWSPCLCRGIDWLKQ